MRIVVPVEMKVGMRKNISATMKSVDIALIAVLLNLWDISTGNGGSDLWGGGKVEENDFRHKIGWRWFIFKK